MTFEFTNLQINMAILGCISKSSSVRASTGRFGLVTYSVHLLMDLSCLVWGFTFHGCFGILFQVQVVSGNGLSEHSDNHRTPDQCSKNATFNRPVT